MAKLINKINLKNFYNEFQKFEDEINREHEMKIEIEYRPFSNNQDEVVGITEVYNISCLDCGKTDEIVNQIFTNGNEDLEFFALEMGYRNEENCDNFYCNEDFEEMKNEEYFKVLQKTLVELVDMKPQSKKEAMSIINEMKETVEDIADYLIDNV